VLHAAGLHYHKEKEFIDRPGDVTGVIFSHGRLLLPNRQHLKIRQAKVDLGSARGEIEKHAALARLRGLSGQHKQITRTANRLDGQASTS
jgi:hypothetical protein